MKELRELIAAEPQLMTDNPLMIHESNQYEDMPAGKQIGNKANKQAVLAASERLKQAKKNEQAIELNMRREQ